MPPEPSFASAVLDATVHDTVGFDSGQGDLDDWLRRSAPAAARSRVAQTFVWTSGDQGAPAERVLAFYALSAHAIARAEVPSRTGRGVPDPVPAALIAKLALDRSLQGAGLGGPLLVDALERILRAGQQGPAVRAIVVDAATAAGRSLCTRFGFVAAPGREDRMIVRAETIARALGLEGA